MDEHGEQNEERAGGMRGPTRRLVWFILLGLYSATILAIEACTSQQYVRHFVTDIKGPVSFYGINTTLSAFLLWGAALLFGVCMMSMERAREDRRTFWFFVSQIALFAWDTLADRIRVLKARRPEQAS